jgi:hypothetical protein
MMIQLVDTLSTGTAMGYSGKLVIVALITMSGSEKVLGIDDLVFDSIHIEQFGEFRDSIFNAIGLSVAPERHGHIKPYDIG